MKWDISHFNQYTSVLVEILVFREEGGADLEMLRYLIFVMSLSGSVIVVLYKLFAPIFSAIMEKQHLENGPYLLFGSGADIQGFSCEPHTKSFSLPVRVV